MENELVREVGGAELVGRQGKVAALPTVLFREDGVELEGACVKFAPREGVHNPRSELVVADTWPTFGQLPNSFQCQFEPAGTEGDNQTPFRNGCVK